ncbi:MAG: tRNA (adenosine(37)-N6)-threonylcarbamoyltransferase complex dimerization subunit type 1 TsaB [Dysgonamonadaceae bacterium]|nr:tRNA (adenosine(37)-N6)-threonylcarbamoyltransferase complex dimerization subunit type 1 TsaB [Dysgonamonadaceae bacterium]
MACILNIETSTKACSLAVSVNEEIVFNRIQTEKVSHVSLIGVYGKEAMDFMRKNNLKPDAVAVSAGPGSYTGLRIGVSYAKGLCYGLNVPLIAIPTLKIMTLSALEQIRDEESCFCPMIDARRMEVYSAIYDSHLNEIRAVRADIVEENSYREYLASGKMVFFGDGSDKCKEIIHSENAIFMDDIFPSADKMASLSEKACSEKNFVQAAYFEPFYLKEFQATAAKNKVLKTKPTDE